MARRVVLGGDSSTLSSKVVALGVDDGQIYGEGRASHSGADVQHPNEWWSALKSAVSDVLSADVHIVGLAIAGQQHGCVLLDASGDVVRPAPLWNNVAAAPD